jgi:hypothetical protein
MRTTLVPALLAAAVALGAGQDLRHATRAVNIEVPIRVFDGDRFVDTLTLRDFEVLENGRPQKVEAVYLVRGTDIARREETRTFNPDTGRNFFLFFEVAHVTGPLAEAVDVFVRTVLLPGDLLTVVTPLKTYRMKTEAFDVVSKSRVAAQLLALLRRDVLIGYAEYRDAVDDLAGMAKSMAAALTQSVEASIAAVQSIDPTTATALPQHEGFTLDEQLTRYGDLLEKLQTLRRLDQKKFLEFAEILEDRAGQKYVFVLYEREYLPKIDPKILYQYIDLYQDRPDIHQTISGLFELYRRRTTLNTEEIKLAYANASTSIHFLMLTQPREEIPGVLMEESIEDVFGPFREMARATGGVALSGGNPAGLIREAVRASQNYYLLYYSPASYAADGKFRSVTVRVPSASYRVAHRAGYVAD